MSDAAPGYLRPYLRALWRQAPSVGRMPPAAGARALLGDRLLLIPCDRPDAPPADRRRLHLATAAHAGAHVRFGRGAFERGRLKPVQMAVLEVLEDARVEWLAARELPGLQRLWLDYHLPDAGADFESLLRRLSRSLLDAKHSDAHPWVSKARRLFFADAAEPRLAELSPAGLRAAASILGNDIGQMRLQFNARLYLVQPAYRDDNTHLWQEEARLVEAPQDAPASPTPPPAGASGAATSLLSPEPGTTYPEWDRLIRRLRAAWVTVQEQTDTSRAPAPADPAAQALQDALDRQAPMARRLQRLLAKADLAGRLAHSRFDRGRDRAEDGAELHLGAAVAARIAQRAGMAPDPRVHLRAARSSVPLCVLIMLDASLSTARAAVDGSGPVLHSARLAALLLASALEAEDHGCAVQAFSSNGRHEVLVQPVKAFEERCADTQVIARAQALKSRWSTRIGAAVRHAAARMRGRPEPVKLVLLVSDGEPHDIDVHDPRYLVDDLRQAVRASAGQGVRVACVNIGGAAAVAGDPLRAAFPAGAYQLAARLGDFPASAVAALRCAGRPA